MKCHKNASWICKQNLKNWPVKLEKIEMNLFLNKVIK